MLVANGRKNNVKKAVKLLQDKVPGIKVIKKIS